MRPGLALLIAIVLAACGKPAADPSAVNAANGVVPAVNCADPGSYDVKVLALEPRSINVMSDGKLVRSIDVPSPSEVPGFTLDWAKKTERGFDISIEFGSRIYFGKRLIFECRKDAFYLTGVDVESFDKNNLSKKKHKTVELKSPVPLARVRLIDQTTDAPNAGFYP